MGINEGTNDEITKFFNVKRSYFVFHAEILRALGKDDLLRFFHDAIRVGGFTGGQDLFGY